MFARDSEGGLESGLETRSELLVRNASAVDNGTFYCRAENKADRIVSNFTLHVTKTGRLNDYAPTSGIFHLRLEHFVAAAVGVLVVLVLMLVAIAILLVKMCRKRASKRASARVAEQINKSIMLSHNEPNKKKSILLGNSRIAPSSGTSSTLGRMPKHIQMGTGGLLNTTLTTTSSSSTASGGNGAGCPDLLTDHNHQSSGSEATSRLSGSGSYKRAMDNIIGDYRYIWHRNLPKTVLS